MHEFSIASGIIESVLEEAQKHHASKITRLSLQIGPLSMIASEQLRFALEVLGEGTAAEGAKIEIENLPLKIRCEKGHVSDVTPKGPAMYSFLQKLRCPVCGEAVETVGGRECTIREIAAE